MSAAHKLYSQSNAGLHVSAELTNPSSGLLSKTNSKEMQWHVTMSICQHYFDMLTRWHVTMSICQMMVTCWHDDMSPCQYANMMVTCHHVNISPCQYVKMILTCWHVDMSPCQHFTMSICHCISLLFVSRKRPDDGLVNSAETCSPAVDWEYQLCSNEILLIFHRLSHIRARCVLLR